MDAKVERAIVKLGNLENGSLFIYKDTIALKSEYRTEKGACECHIVGSGEMFWGGTSTPEDLNNLYVTPILLTLNKGNIHDEVKALNLDGNAFDKTLMDIHKEGY